MLKHIYYALPSKNTIFRDKDTVEFFLPESTQDGQPFCYKRTSMFQPYLNVSERIVIEHKGAMEGCYNSDDITADKALRFCLYGKD